MEISKLCTSVSEFHFCLSPDEILHLEAFHLGLLSVFQSSHGNFQLKTSLLTDTK